MVELVGRLESGCLPVHWDAGHAVGSSCYRCYNCRLDDCCDVVEVHIDASAEGLCQTDLVHCIRALVLHHVSKKQL